MKILSIILCCIVLIFNSCKEDENLSSKFSMEDKQWAHHVDDIELANIKKEIFKGIEIDIMFDDTRDSLFVSYDKSQLDNSLALQQYFRLLNNPQKTRYWIDFKNLTEENVKRAATLMLQVFSTFIKNVYIESDNSKALAFLSKKGFNVIYTVGYIPLLNKNDSIAFSEQIQNVVTELKPYALATNYIRYEFVKMYFPQYPVFTWHCVPDSYENFEKTKYLLNEQNIQVVLVDYSRPININ